MPSRPCLLGLLTQCSKASCHTLAHVAVLSTRSGPSLSLLNVSESVRFPGPNSRNLGFTHRLVILIELQVIATELHTEDDGRDALKAVDPFFAL